MHKILSRQISRAQKVSAGNEFSIEQLLNIIEEFYFEVDRERKIKDRSIELMSNELNDLNLQVKKEGERQLSLIMENVEDGIILLDEKFCLINANISFSKLLTPVANLNQDDDSSKNIKWQLIYNSLNLKTGNYQKKNTIFLTAGKSAYYFELSLNPTTLNNQAGFIGILRDVTLIKQQKIKLESDQKILIQKIEKSESTLIALNDSLHKESSERRAAEATLEYMAYHDPLTGLMNRIAVKNFFEKRITELKHGEKIGVLFAELDKFKIINDSLGHHTGDILLQEVSKRLKDEVGNKGQVSHPGGDGFIIILDHIKSNEDIIEICKSLIKSISTEYNILNQSLIVDLSLGISVFPEDGDDFDSLVRTADIAMFAAKEQGLGQFEFYKTEMSLNLYEQLTLGNLLKMAVQKEELLLLFQPKYSVEKKCIDSAEALIRWNHPEIGLISPTKFIPIAEQYGIIGRIGEWVIHKACKEIQAWSRSGTAMRIAVNLSPIQFSNVNINKQIENILNIYQIDPCFLEFEITESGIMKDVAYTKKILSKLKDLGVTITIDDFGTGYSSLSYLKELPIDNLKIDKSFIDGIPENKKDCAIVEAIINLSKSLGLYVIAEGVEKEEQKAFLENLGCNSIQGYLIGRPQKVENLILMKNSTIS